MLDNGRLHRVKCGWCGLKTECGCLLDDLAYYPGMPASGRRVADESSAPERRPLVPAPGRSAASEWRGWL
jgi:hypothetical protein